MQLINKHVFSFPGGSTPLCQFSFYWFQISSLNLVPSGFPYKSSLIANCSSFQSLIDKLLEKVIFESQRGRVWGVFQKLLEVFLFVTLIPRDPFQSDAVLPVVGTFSQNSNFEFRFGESHMISVSTFAKLKISWSFWQTNRRRLDNVVRTFSDCCAENVLLLFSPLKCLLAERSLRCSFNKKAKRSTLIFRIINFTGTLLKLKSFR